MRPAQLVLIGAAIAAALGLGATSGLVLLHLHLVALVLTTL